MDRKNQLMQEALDGELSPEQQQELDAILDGDQERAEYDKLQVLDDILRTAPHERAPQRLALKIMGRIAESVKAQQKHNMEAELTEIAEAVIDVAMTTVTVATLPLLVGASWLMLNAQARPEVAEDVLAKVTALFILTIDVIQVMLEEAEAAYDPENPEVSMAILTMIPSTLLLLVKQVMGLEDDDETDDDSTE